jgi:two-component system sensor histidine kinase UhpB
MMPQMEPLFRIGGRYRQSLRQVSIFNRVLIGNSAIIVAGAIAGTIITRQLTLFGNAWLILLFASVGVAITLLVNRAIIRSAMHPLRQLGEALEHAQGGQFDIPAELREYQDPDIHRLIQALEGMLNRLDEHARELEAISERAINAQEQERVRIARSLHDDTAQSISTLIIRLDRLAGMLPSDSPQLASYVADARSVATQLLENLRKVIWDLRPSILDDLGLSAAVRWFARDNLEPVGVRVDYWTPGDMVRLPPHLETMLFRISQEAISNILRHAEASRVEIRLWRESRDVFLEIRDDGRGFDIEETAGNALGRKQLGLLGIQERVSLVGGELEVRSSAGSGTSLRVRVPVPVEDVNESGEAGIDPIDEPDVVAQP